MVASFLDRIDAGTTGGGAHHASPAHQRSHGIAEPSRLVPVAGPRPAGDSTFVKSRNNVVAVVKATSKDAVPPKMKHLLRLVNVTWERGEQGAEEVMAQLGSRFSACVGNSPSHRTIATKLLLVTHKLLQEGSPETIRCVHRSAAQTFLNELQTFFESPGRFNPSAHGHHLQNPQSVQCQCRFLASYAALLIERANFHESHPDFVNNFSLVRGSPLAESSPGHAAVAVAIRGLLSLLRAVIDTLHLALRFVRLPAHNAGNGSGSSSSDHNNGEKDIVGIAIAAQLREVEQLHGICCSLISTGIASAAASTTGVAEAAVAGLSGCSGPDEALTQMKIMYSEFFKTHARILEVHEVYHAATREGTLTPCIVLPSLESSPRILISKEHATRMGISAADNSISLAHSPTRVDASGSVMHRCVSDTHAVLSRHARSSSDMNPIAATETEARTTTRAHGVSAAAHPAPLRGPSETTHVMLAGVGLPAVNEPFRHHLQQQQPVVVAAAGDASRSGPSLHRRSYSGGMGLVSATVVVNSHSGRRSGSMSGGSGGSGVGTHVHHHTHHQHHRVVRDGERKLSVDALFAAFQADCDHLKSDPNFQSDDNQGKVSDEHFADLLESTEGQLSPLSTRQAMGRGQQVASASASERGTQPVAQCHRRNHYHQQQQPAESGVPSHDRVLSRSPMDRFAAANAPRGTSADRTQAGQSSSVVVESTEPAGRCAASMDTPQVVARGTSNAGGGGVEDDRPMEWTTFDNNSQSDDSVSSGQNIDGGSSHEGVRHCVRNGTSSDANERDNGGGGSSRRYDIAIDDLVLTGEKIGRGAFGDVVVAVYKGKEVAVKRISHPTTDGQIGTTKQTQQEATPSGDRRGSHRCEPTKTTGSLEGSAKEKGNNDDDDDSGGSSTTSSSMRDFKHEARLLCKLRHKNIIEFIGACATSSEFLIVMEICRNGSLRQVLRDESRSLSGKQVVRWSIEAARGMLYLHSRSPPVVHRDLKSVNLLIDSDNVLKVSDFGLARCKTSSYAYTQVGTWGWMAPEILENSPYTERADVYSFGVVMWELLTRDEPWKHMHPMQIMRAIDRGQRPVLTSDVMRFTDIGEDYNELLQQCWRSDPRERPAFDEIVARLEACLESIEVDARTGSGHAAAVDDSGTEVEAEPQDASV